MTTPWYHAAPAAFTRFRPGTSESLGIHLGTREQALARARHAQLTSTGVLLTVQADLQRGLRLADGMQWRPYPVFCQLRHQFPDLQEARDFVPTAKGMRDLIQRLGFDHVVYLNRFESITTDLPSLDIHVARYAPERVSDTQFLERFPAARDSVIILDRKCLTVVDQAPLSTFETARAKPRPGF